MIYIYISYIYIIYIIYIYIHSYVNLEKSRAGWVNQFITRGSSCTPVGGYLMAFPLLSMAFPECRALFLVSTGPREAR